MTEWYDDSEPPDRGIRLQDEDTNLPWSSLHAGLRVRWKTQTFVKRGSIVSLHKRSMVVRFDAHDVDTVIPDAKWYFVEGKVGNMNEHLVTISTPARERSPVALEANKRRRTPEDSDWLSPVEVASIMGTDPKNVRRMIRAERLPASRIGGRWVVLRKDLQ